MQPDDAARASGKSWEEARWATLSPRFREAHNRLRRARGLPSIPPPKVDLYAPKRGPAQAPFDPSNPEFLASVRQFEGGAIPGAWAQGAGFSINGQEVSFGLNDRERRIERKVRAMQRVEAEDGFTINGRAVR